MKHDLEQDFDGRVSKTGAASGGAVPANAGLAEKEAALAELAAGILQEADEEGRCSALYSRGFFKGVAFCIHANGFASFLPDDRLEQERALRRFLAPYLRQTPQEIADGMVLYEARSQLLTVRAACRQAARAREQRGIILPAADEKALHHRLLAAAAPFAAANRKGWIALDFSDAEADLAYAAGRTQGRGMME